MSGFNLIISSAGKAGEQTVRNMNRAVAPGDGGQTATLTANKWAAVLGAESIARESHDQPLVSECGKYALVFEGDLDSRFDLRNRLLEKGKTFRTGTDAELLLFALIEFGPELVADLEGVFAFIFLDAHKGEVLLGRDRLGAKPLYYYHEEGSLVVSSGIRGVMASGIPAKELNKQQIANFINFGLPKAPETFYKDVFEVRRGHMGTMLSLGEAPRFDALPNKSTKTEQPTPDIDKLAEEVEERLTDGLFAKQPHRVSFGLIADGSLYTAVMLVLAKKAGTIPSHVFSVGHTSRQEDKLENLLGFLGVSNHPVPFGPDNIDDFGDFVAGMDQPVGHRYAWIRYRTARYAKDFVSVLWGAEGAEELLSGSTRAWVYYHYLRNHETVLKALPYIKKGSKLLPTALDKLSGGLVGFVRKYAERLSESPERTYLKLINDDSSVKENPYPKMFAEDSDNSGFVDLNFANLCQFERGAYLQRSVLPVHQFLFQSCGMDLRMPYLTSGLMELSESVSPVAWMERGRNAVLEKILERNGAERFIGRIKARPEFPLGVWLREDWRQHTESLANSESLTRFVDSEWISKIIAEHLDGTRDHGELIWRLLVLRQWIADK
ncbi:asparagine synthetase B [Fulvitalea axinellae]|uniref:asparagine synthase (glutamine-hydrolyzing) n=1 Tax=Fulvitalea axinellae TaxID=1182444 RepID=A0AAU9CMB5_9BACT|nr:asparagine synthetase B [Fulvitalea axinellae]